jgi:hypothetical protein
MLFLNLAKSQSLIYKIQLRPALAGCRNDKREKGFSLTKNSLAKAF